ncbi:retinol dehydrogenase 14-like [Aricia agestis]|uniref:retinol dehydrogenase 14-like n=1 Tax=Aricia agestis TaxID=91739 RepID=UPI001C20B079|nr:retinol dehydrogenase 14-like [Aricia agestis]
MCVSSRHLVGKVVLVTGGTSGIGYETAADLAERGARVLIASNERHGDSVRDTIVARSGNTDVHFIYLDLASLDSVRSVANHILSTEKRLDVLINNAGALFTGNKKSKDGLLLGMQINYFGPFLLTMLLLPLLKKTAPSRIVNVSSKSYQHGTVDLKDINKGHTGFLSFYFTYSDAKLCVALITMELSRRLEGSGVTANFLHPGSAKTNINTMWIARTLYVLLKGIYKTPRHTAQTSIHLAVSPQVENISGCYFRDCQLKRPHKKVFDKELARDLWDLSIKLVKLDK